jgi:PhnB protein
MAQITPYVNFDGNCRDAMTFYKECLGGELALNVVGDSPGASQMPADSRDKIMHASLTGAGSKDVVLMASDWMGGGQRVNGNSITLSIPCTSADQINTLFANLSSGGKVTIPLADQFWGATFGALTDQFGINWMLNYDKTPQQ